MAFKFEANWPAVLQASSVIEERHLGPSVQNPESIYYVDRRMDSTREQGASGDSPKFVKQSGVIMLPIVQW